MSHSSNRRQQAVAWLRALLLFAGCILVAQLGLALTGLQRHLDRWLNTPDRALPVGVAPDYVAVLSGGAMPSEDTLIRLYWAAEVYRQYPDSRFPMIVASARSAEEMRAELILRGIPQERILVETLGRNTFEQARGVQRIVGPAASTRSIAIVTNGQHRRRSAMAFEAAGFGRVYVYGGMRGSSEEADRGRGTYLRYGIWYELSSQPYLLRELVALLFYRLRARL